MITYSWVERRWKRKRKGNEMDDEAEMSCDDDDDVDDDEFLACFLFSFFAGGIYG